MSNFKKRIRLSSFFLDLCIFSFACIGNIITRSQIAIEIRSTGGSSSEREEGSTSSQLQAPLNYILPITLYCSRLLSRSGWNKYKFFIYYGCDMLWQSICH